MNLSPKLAAEVELWSVGIWHGGEPDRDASDIYDETLEPATVVYRTREAAVAHVERELHETLDDNPYFLDERSLGLDEMDQALEAREDLPPDPGVELFWEGDVCRVRGAESMGYPPTGVIARVRVEG